MAVLPISAEKIDSRNNGVNFTGIRKNKYSSEINNDSARSNDLAKVPVVLMIAMSPAMMNGKTPIQYMPLDEGNMTEMFEQAPVEVNDRTYVARPEEFQQSYPLGVAYFDDLRIQQVKPAIGNGVKANLVLTAYKPNKNKNNVDQVYYVEHSFRYNNKLIEPPLVQELIYHNLGSDKEYLGILIKKKIYPNETSPKVTKVVYSEVKLDDESAQFLLDFQAGSTRWNDRTGIKFTETTRPNVKSPEIIKY